MAPLCAVALDDVAGCARSRPGPGADARLGQRRSRAHRVRLAVAGRLSGGNRGRNLVVRFDRPFRSDLDETAQRLDGYVENVILSGAGRVAPFPLKGDYAQNGK